MSDPCMQIDRLEKIDDHLSRLTDILTTVAVQKKEIEHIVEGLADLKSWLQKLEARMQIQESSGGASASKFLWMLVAVLLSATMSSVITMVVTK